MFGLNRVIQNFVFILITLGLSLIVHAKSYDWDNISQQQYIDNLVECKATLDELKWSHNIWPKENKTAKPLFADVVDKEQIRQSVLNNLKMQAVLSNSFNFEISQEILQYDLDRMARNTKDAKRLKQLFAVLDNNPVTIAQCVSRPYLVQKKLADQYNYNEKIHVATRDVAKIELDNYLSNNSAKNLKAEELNITYQLLNDSKAPVDEFIDSKQETQTTIIELDKKEFQQKFQQLKNTQLQQSQSNFFYNQIQQQTQDSLTVKTLIWQKQSQHHWLKKQAGETYHYPNTQNKLSLPTIKASNKAFNENTIKSTINDTWEATSSTNAPTARKQHTAIWTGSEMVVWGGSIFLNSGGRYNPSMDSWVATSLTNAPVARKEHTVIWTGTKMVVWGGKGIAGSLNSGGRYNPSSNTWDIAPISTANAAVARRLHTAIWSGSEMVVWGGFGNAGSLNSGGRYNPSTNTWDIMPISTTNAPVARAFHSAIWTGSEMLVWGGFGNSGRLNSGGRYNPSTNTWDIMPISTTNAPVARAFHSAIWTGSEMVIWGGEDVFSSRVNNGGLYNPSSNTWDTNPINTSSNTPIARRGHKAIWTGSEMIVWGGQDSSLSVLNSGGRYNPSDNSWVATSLTNVPVARVEHTAVLAGSKMIIWGGKDGGNLDSIGIYALNTSYDVGGNLTGLLGNQVILQNNNGDDITLSADGSFTFSTELIEGDSYAVSVLTNPTNPSQTCSVSNGTGINILANVTNISVTCVTNKFNVGATVSGLSAGIFALQNNSSDDLYIATDGAYTFNTMLDDLSPYAVSVLTQPTTPNQTCVVTGGDNGDGTGGISGGNDLSIIITCTTTQYTLGVTVLGLNGNNVVLQNNSGDDLSISNNSLTPFGTSIDDLTNYSVSVLTQPSNPSQTCAVLGGDNGDGTGQIDNGNDNSIVVNCVTNQYSLGVTVSGLGAGSLVLQNNLSDNLNIAIDGSYTFSTQLDDLSAYSVSVATSPSMPSQTCAITGGDNSDGTGVLSGANDLSIVVTCVTNKYSVGVVVSGLVIGNPFTLQNNSGDNLTVSNGVPINFATPLDDGSSYSVTVLNNPVLTNQTCIVDPATASGTLNGASVVIAITCTINQYNVEVTVFGFGAGSLVLQNNLTDDLTISSDGSHTFNTMINDKSTYSITVLTNPTNPSQTCLVQPVNASGTISGSAVNIPVACVTNKYSIGVTISGLAPGNSVTLQNNGGDDLIVSDGLLNNFATQLNDGTAYSLSVLTDPAMPNQTCNITGGTGNLAGADVNISINCVTTQYDINVTVSGLATNNSVTLANSADTLTISDGIVHTLSTLADGTGYAVSVTSEPTTPNQVCSITGGTGTLAGGHVAVAVNCVTTQYNVGVTVSGLAPGNSVTLQNNGGDDLIISDGLLNNFASQLNDGTAYSLSVLTDPMMPNQTCVVDVASASGALNGANVNILVVCTTDKYNIGVTVSGLATGNSFILQNNGVDFLIVSDGLLNNFTTQLVDQSAYSISVFANPTAPNQTCVVDVASASGTLNGANVNILVVCTTDKYNIGVTVSGLATGNSVILQNNNGDDLTVSDGLLNNFSTQLADESGYLVSVLTNPTTPNQICIVDEVTATGTLNGAPVSISVVCTTIKYNVNVTVTGLAVGNTIDVTNVGVTKALSNTITQTSFNLDDGTSYSVTTTNATTPNQVCSVIGGVGTLAGSHVAVSIACATESYFVGGMTTGLVTGNSITLNLGAETLQVDSTTFIFNNPLSDLSQYLVDIISHPTSPSQSCSLLNNSGQITGNNVTNLEVNCLTNTFSIGGNVTGLLSGNSFVLQNNSNDDLVVLSNGSYTFATKLNDLSNYIVTLKTPASNPVQPCAITQTNTQLAGENIVDVDIVCEIGEDLIFAQGFE